MLLRVCSISLFLNYFSSGMKVMACPPPFAMRIERVSSVVTVFSKISYEVGLVSQSAFAPSA